MTTRRNHGAQKARRRHVALRNNLERLKIGYHNIFGGNTRKLTDEAREAIQAEIDVLKKRGAS